MVKDNWSLIERDHENLIARLAEMESDWVWRKAELETERFRAISRAKANIKAYTPAYKAKKEAAEKERKERIAATKKALWEFEWDELPALQEEGIQAITLDRFWTLWSPQYPEEAEGQGNLNLTVKDDASLLASGEPGNSVVYTMTFPVDAETISGFMLEVLTDDSLASFGRDSTKRVTLSCRRSRSVIPLPPRPIRKIGSKSLCPRRRRITRKTVSAWKRSSRQ